jgi:hypothetical protein
MTTTKDRLFAAATVIGGVFWAAFGALKVTHPGYLDTTKLQNGMEHVGMAGLAGALLLTIPGMLILARYATRREGAIVAAIGMTALAALVTVSNIMGDDPAFFPAVAAPANLLWLGGSVALAVALRRAGRVSKAIAYLLPVVWITALPLSSVGGGLITGSYWITVGYLAYAGALERPAVTPVTA